MITILGLGPAGLDRLSPEARQILLDERAEVIVRTLHHPAAADLAAMRTVGSGDDLYESSADFDAVYEALAHRVVDLAATTDEVIYAVPGSPLVGERSVTEIRRLAAAAGIAVSVTRSESFLDLCFDRVGIDPIADGVQVLDGRNLPDPMPLHLPTFITQVDGPVLLADVAATLSRVLEDDHPIVVLRSLGSTDEVVSTSTVGAVTTFDVDVRTSLYVPPAEVGWLGLVSTNRALRRECPWDAEQTHHSLVKHLIEEAYETVDAIAALSPEAPEGDVDYVAYAGLEDELGDLLLQVVFHATLASEVGAFDVEQVAEVVRRKLVRRHPHVFGDVAVSSADQVRINWEAIKTDEKQRDSLMDDVPSSLPAVVRSAKVQARAASVGFDWDHVVPVFDKVREELDELVAAVGDPAATAEELGDLLFAVVNLSRHLEVDAEAALRSASQKFESRFRAVEAMGSVADADLAELDRRWEAAKAAESS